MSWKDLLFIPKSDKIAIVILGGIIIILLLSIVLNSPDKHDGETSELIELSDDYKDWQADLLDKVESNKVENSEFYQQQNYTYQQKFKQGETIELNSADTTSLKKIPGIGSGYANKIVKYRELLGGYVEIEQLNEVWGLDEYLYSQITPYLILKKEYKPIQINSDSFKQLIRHPYIDYKQALVIVDIRERKGAIKSIKRLELLDEFKKKDIERLSKYISYE